jgi:hypothetical protein
MEPRGFVVELTVCSYAMIYLMRMAGSASRGKITGTAPGTRI